MTGPDSEPLSDQWTRISQRRWQLNGTIHGIEWVRGRNPPHTSGYRKIAQIPGTSRWQPVHPHNTRLHPDAVHAEAAITHYHEHGYWNILWSA